MAKGLTRSIWVWNTTTILSSPDQIHELVAGTQRIGISDVYLYMAPSFYDQYKLALQTLICSATSASMRIWALDGDRAYLDDSAGPSNFYTGIENLIAYNCSVSADERFFGLQADIEPQDDSTHTSFHNEVAGSALSTQPGSGSWQLTQAGDREMLMHSWLKIHQTAGTMLHAHGLQFGAAMPFWTQSYCGEEVKAKFPKTWDAPRGVMKHMMDLVDEYVVMSYNTDPENAANRVVVPAVYAGTFDAGSRTRVYGSMEVSAGVGANVSYADTAGKNSKAVVMQDMERMVLTLERQSAFKGIALHHWSSWQVMPE